MKLRLYNLSLTKLAALATYLFIQTSGAATQSPLQNTQISTQHEVQIVEEIKSGFAVLLADIGFPEVKQQVKQQLKHHDAEFQATELVKAATEQLPEYKFKVVISE